MGWPRRMYEPREIYFITVRCLHGRLFLRPSVRTNEVLGGVLARAVRLGGVELFAFTFASNHVHLLLRAPRGNLPRFMQHLLSNISKKIGALVGWRGAFWERRYSSEPVLDDEALLDRLRYILAHGVKEGLVSRCRDWPGLSSLTMMLDGQSREFRWYSWCDRWRHRSNMKPCSRFDRRCSKPESLELSQVPHPLFREGRTRVPLLRRMIETIEEVAAKVHTRVLGRENVLAQRPQRRPDRPDRSPRPLCHTASVELFEEYRDRYRAFVSWFVQASQRWRSGDFSAVFPARSSRPIVALDA